MSKAREILIAARKMIEREENWCQKLLRVTASDGKVVRRCAADAINCATQNVGATPEDCADALDVLRGALPSEADRLVGRWNDTHSHAEVIAGFTKAIDGLTK